MIQLSSVPYFLLHGEKEKRKKENPRPTVVVAMVVEEEEDAIGPFLLSG